MSTDISEAPAAPPIRQRTYIAVPRERVFDALAAPEGWDAWFTRGMRLDPRPGGAIHFRWENPGAERGVVEDHGSVLEIARPERFVFDWNPLDHPTRVAFELAESGGGTVVTVTESGFRLTEREVEQLQNNACGWGEALTLLKFYLEYGLTYRKPE